MRVRDTLPSVRLPRRRLYAVLCRACARGDERWGVYAVSHIDISLLSHSTERSDQRTSRSDSPIVFRCGRGVRGLGGKLRKQNATAFTANYHPGWYHRATMHHHAPPPTITATPSHTNITRTSGATAMVVTATRRRAICTFLTLLRTCVTRSRLWITVSK